MFGKAELPENPAKRKKTRLLREPLQSRCVRFLHITISSDPFRSVFATTEHKVGRGANQCQSNTSVASLTYQTIAT